MSPAHDRGRRRLDHQYRVWFRRPGRCVPSRLFLFEGALHTLTRNVAVQLGHHNIRCNAVLPGLVLSTRAREIMTAGEIDFHPAPRPAAAAKQARGHCPVPCCSCVGRRQLCHRAGFQRRRRHRPSFALLCRPDGRAAVGLTCPRDVGPVIREWPRRCGGRRHACPPAFQKIGVQGWIAGQGRPICNWTHVCRAKSWKPISTIMSARRVGRAAPMARCMRSLR